MRMVWEDTDIENDDPLINEKTKQAEEAKEEIIGSNDIHESTFAIILSLMSLKAQTTSFHFK